MLIRKFSGGFHLNSSAVCFVSSTALLSLFIFIVKFVTISAQIPLFTGGVVLAAIQIFLCSPIDNEARKLSEKETVTFRTVARVMVIVFLAVYVVLTCVKQWRFSVPSEPVSLSQHCCNFPVYLPENAAPPDFIIKALTCITQPHHNTTSYLFLGSGISHAGEPKPNFSFLISTE